MRFVSAKLTSISCTTRSDSAEIYSRSLKFAQIDIFGAEREQIIAGKAGVLPLPKSNPTALGVEQVPHGHRFIKAHLWANQAHHSPDVRERQAYFRRVHLGTIFRVGGRLRRLAVLMP